MNDLFDPPGRGVPAVLFSHGSDYLLVLVNEDAHRHLAVDVTGLDALDGRCFEQLYGPENVEVTYGGFVTRLQGHEVKVFATNAVYASTRREGRDYGRSDRK